MRLYFDPSLLIAIYLPEARYRSFDLIHVAVAAISGLRDFATLDVGQAGLARAAGLTVIQLPA